MHGTAFLYVGSRAGTRGRVDAFLLPGRGLARAADLGSSSKYSYAHSLKVEVEEGSPTTAIARGLVGTSKCHAKTYVDGRKRSVGREVNRPRGSRR